MKNILLNILLVDDDKVCNFISTKMLEQIGLDKEIRTAMNGAEALALLNDFFPDLILLDLDMPVMNGFGFIEAFKKSGLANKDSVQIVILTSSDSPRDVANAKELGVSQYLSKPLNATSLLAVLNPA